MWRRSTYCNGAASCVEVRWIKALACNNGECIEVGLHAGHVWVRDSKLGDDSPVLKVPAEDWSAFLEAVKGGYLCWPGGRVHYSHVGVDVWDMWLTSDSETGLQFTDREMDAFVKGVHAKEFDLTALSAGGRLRRERPGARR